MKLKFLTVIIISIFFIGCGSSFYLNKDYNFTKKEKIHLAIVPVGNEHNFADTAFKKLFEDSTGFQTLMEPEEIRRIMADNPEITQIINNIIMKQYSNNELDEGPNLNNLLGEKNFWLLTSELKNEDIILVPVVFNIYSSLGHTFGKDIFRLYDLHNGKLIYENSENINVNITGPRGERNMTAVLIAIASSDYAKNYLTKIRNGQ